MNGHEGSEGGEKSKSRAAAGVRPTSLFVTVDTKTSVLNKVYAA